MKDGLPEVGDTAVFPSGSTGKVVAVEKPGDLQDSVIVVLDVPNPKTVHSQE